MIYQKCLNCNSEWNGRIELKICPFCQKKFEQQVDNFEDIEMAFKYVFKKHGVEVIKNKNLVSLLSDYAPTLVKERRIVKIAIDSGVYESLLDVDKTDKNKQEVIIAKAIDKLNCEYLLDLNWSQMAVSWLLSALKHEFYLNKPIENISARMNETQIHITTQKSTQNINHTEGTNLYKCKNYSEQIEIGNMVLFGSYPYLVDGTKKKLEWEILDIRNGKVLLWSTKCIDSYCYDEKNNCLTWKDCDLRVWLRDFANKAFQGEEQQALIFSKIESSDSLIKRYDQEFIEDKVFILSRDEVNQYRISQDKLKGKATPYALRNGIYIGKGGEAFYWLRTHGSGSEGCTQMFVGLEGNINESGNYANQKNRGIRPAVWVDHKTFISILNKREDI